MTRQNKYAFFLKDVYKREYSQLSSRVQSQ